MKPLYSSLLGFFVLFPLSVLFKHIDGEDSSSLTLLGMTIRACVIPSGARNLGMTL